MAMNETNAHQEEATSLKPFVNEDGTIDQGEKGLKASGMSKGDDRETIVDEVNHEITELVGESNPDPVLINGKEITFLKIEDLLDKRGLKKKWWQVYTSSAPSGRHYD